MARFMPRLVISTIAALFAFTWLFVPAAEPDDRPFEGKTIRLVVGYAPGGGFDTFARIVARHLPRYIPGEPGIIVQNMPGAGSLVAANWAYARQPGDGRTIVTFHSSLIIQALIDPAAKFDPLKYIWLGDPSIGSLPQVLWVRSDLPIRSLDDLKRTKEPVALGVTGVGTGAAVVGEFLRSIGLPVKNVAGYAGSAPTMAALEKKEIDGRILPQDTMQTVYKRFIDGNMVRPVLAFGSDPRVEPLRGVATMEDLKMTPEQRQFAEFLMDTLAFLRLFAIPPGTPGDRVEILRGAFMSALKDPKLIKEAERQGVTVSPVSAAVVEHVVRKLAQTPREVLDRYRDLLAKR